ncbi:hypothetical protein FH972_027146 [Carpinus fangiana]|uniref:TF-B3 domain-containing protein n=1 Tax=Carpinus fangiana TaxID=176857 RepID=A0A5N6L6G1_9ROSI|nr:hypothetical protein FH972_027146 [Carpinus fangiana]
MAATTGDANSASSGIYPAWPPACEGHGSTKVCPKCMYKDYEREVVFKKILCRSDIQEAGSYRLYVPKEHAARLCSLANGSEVITFCDVQSQSWPMGFRTSGTGNAYLGAGWIEFAREKQLRAGDTLIFYEVRCGQRTRFFMIAVSYKDRLQILGAPIHYTN